MADNRSKVVCYRAAVAIVVIVAETVDLADLGLVVVALLIPPINVAQYTLN